VTGNKQTYIHLIEGNEGRNSEGKSEHPHLQDTNGNVN
jgi:hypothetical protein